MEKNRTLYAIFGAVIILLFIISPVLAQDKPPHLDKKERVKPDTTLKAPEPRPDSIFTVVDSIFADSNAVGDSVITTAAIVDTIYSDYFRRAYQSTGVEDEIKAPGNLFIQGIGTIGSPQFALPYLNTPGIEICINGKPFYYNGIYRPYVIGTDLNAIPWEIFQNYNKEELIYSSRMRINLGKPSDRINRSDIEIARGPFGYDASRWRFFRPIFTNGYAYFTVGFKKADGYLVNSDYKGYHVTGGISKELAGGTIDINLWKHNAKSGLNSFDFMPVQIERQNRTLKRIEGNYNRLFFSKIDLNVSGLFNRSAQRITGRLPDRDTKLDITGGDANIAIKDSVIPGRIGFDYYQTDLYGLAGNIPKYYYYDIYYNYNKNAGKTEAKIDIKYNWNSIEKEYINGVFLLTYKCKANLQPFIAYEQSRRKTDLYLLYYNERVDGLGLGDILNSYEFRSSQNLKSPKIKSAAMGIKSKIWYINSIVSLSYKNIVDQIYIRYEDNSAGNYIAYPTNIDDKYYELTAALTGDYIGISGELYGSFRYWNDKYFPDNLEKGPKALGSGRVSYRRTFFVTDLYFGGTLEFKVSTRRDYRSLNVGYTDWFSVVSGRLEFQYKSFLFWLNDENLINEDYISWWPYVEMPRAVWWGLRWQFFD